MTTTAPDPIPMAEFEWSYSELPTRHGRVMQVYMWKLTRIVPNRRALAAIYQVITPAEELFIFNDAVYANMADARTAVHDYPRTTRTRD